MGKLPGVGKFNKKLKVAKIDKKKKEAKLIYVNSMVCDLLGGLLFIHVENFNYINNYFHCVILHSFDCICLLKLGKS